VRQLRQLVSAEKIASYFFCTGEKRSLMLARRGKGES
jgi:hypothetical protein